jgi:hypothetical protein
LRNKPGVTFRVVLNPGFKIVALAIELDNQAMRMANKIGNVFVHWHLPTK